MARASAAISARALLFLLAAQSTLGEPEVRELHAQNFDEVIEQNDEVLVHFHAPWSQRCQTMRPHLKAIAQGEPWGERFVWAESDISDQRGYTSYLDRYGVLKLPTVVLFRNGHPSVYPIDNPLTKEDVELWLASATQNEPMPRGASDDAVAVQMQNEQKETIERIRKVQEDAMAQLQQQGTEKKEREKVLKQLDEQQKQVEQMDAERRRQEAAQGAAADAGEGAADEGRAMQEAAEAAPPCASLPEASLLTDANFERVVMDKAKDVFVLFYAPSASFCGDEGVAAYRAFADGLSASPSVVAAHMDVKQHKSPFVFEDSELPVAMLFPAKDKRPLEHDKGLAVDELQAFVEEHATTLQQAAPKKQEL